jgi:hypothetical protein
MAGEAQRRKAVTKSFVLVLGVVSGFEDDDEDEKADEAKMNFRLVLPAAIA